MAIHEPVNKYPLTKQTVCLPGMIKLLFCIKGFIRAQKQIRKERKEATNRVLPVGNFKAYHFGV